MSARMVNPLLAAAIVPVALTATASAQTPGGCSSCAPSNLATKVNSAKGYIADAVFIGGGTRTNAGCPCSASDRTFVFGSCHQFFNPTKSCGNGYHGRTRCDLPMYGPGIGQPANNCNGPYSYHNR